VQPKQLEDYMHAWTARDIPPQAGKRIVITGAASGIGYETAKALAGAGAEVILAGRNPDKVDGAMRGIRARHPDANVRFGKLDLSDLASVYAFARELLDQGQTIDCLINNAGVMAPLTRQETSDGFELQFGTNYLGHFALTAKLLPLLKGKRVVNLASLAHKRGRLDFDDLQAARRYNPWRTYAQSKLAMLMFTLELQRQSDTAGWEIQSIAAHPGWANTDLIANGPANQGGALWAAVRWLTPLFTQSAEAGALPSLYAATAREAQAGSYIGPSGFKEMQGHPTTARIMPQALDKPSAERLWNVSKALTGADWSNTY
jgi:NAD(P)-dependent dehydrogenase (short-subunit alcohol dehydrogenase family)